MVETLKQCLTPLQKNYKPKGSGLYTELVRQLHSITISSERGVRQYEKDFRKVNAEIADLDNSLVLPEPYLIQLFLMGSGEVFEVFVTTYTQTHVLYGPRAAKFDEVSYAAVNEELRILSAKDGGLAMFAARSAKGKSKVTGNSSDGDREISLPCKIAGRKYRHSTVKCWTEFPHLKPEKFMTDEEKKKKAQNAAINSTPSSSSGAPPNKRKRIEEALSNPSAPGEDDYLNANVVYHDDFHILDTAGDEEVISLMAIDTNLEHDLMTADSNLNLCTRTVVDSGCSRHSFADRLAFITYERIQSRPIKGIKGVKVQPLARGTISVECNVNGECNALTLSNVLHVPDMGVNLLSVG